MSAITMSGAELFIYVEAICMRQLMLLQLCGRCRSHKHIYLVLLPAIRIIDIDLWNKLAGTFVKELFSGLVWLL